MPADHASWSIQHLLVAKWHNKNNIRYRLSKPDHGNPKVSFSFIKIYSPNIQGTIYIRTVNKCTLIHFSRLQRYDFVYTRTLHGRQDDEVYFLYLSHLIGIREILITSNSSHRHIRIQLGLLAVGSRCGEDRLSRHITVICMVSGHSGVIFTYPIGRHGNMPHAEEQSNHPEYLSVGCA